MRASTSCCRHCSARPLLAEATPGPAAPLTCRANEMPWSAEWLCCETLAGCTPNPFLHLFVCLSGCSPEVIARAMSVMDFLALDRYTLDRYKGIGTQSLISHPLSYFGLLWASFPSSVFVRAKIRFSAAARLTTKPKPTLPLTNPLATTIRHKGSRSRTPPSCPLPTIAWLGLAGTIHAALRGTRKLCSPHPLSHLGSPLLNESESRGCYKHVHRYCTHLC